MRICTGAIRLSLLLAQLTGAAMLLPAQKITFIREFPGSQPPHMMIELEPSGKAVYKEGADSDWPIRFTLTAEEVKEVYDLAAKLDQFKRELESGLKVAFMGTKTFRWEQGTEKREVKFNYSQDENGKLLLDWFEKMAESEQHFLRLERAVKYDKLGVNQAILYMQAADEKKRLVGLEQFVPLLDRVAKNEAYLHMARERAAQMLDGIRARQAAAAGAAAPGATATPPATKGTQ